MQINFFLSVNWCDWQMLNVLKCRRRSFRSEFNWWGRLFDGLFLGFFQARHTKKIYFNGSHQTNVSSLFSRKLWCNGTKTKKRKEKKLNWNSFFSPRCLETNDDDPTFEITNMLFYFILCFNLWFCSFNMENVFSFCAFRLIFLSTSLPLVSSLLGFIMLLCS
jgi:hypothetical protein